MATLRDIKKRIRAVKNIEKITRAMKMVAAAKLRKAQERMMAARPYARHLRSVIASVAARVPADVHPLLRPNPPGQGVSALVVTADRGLCGSFNAAILRRTRRFIAEQEQDGQAPVRFYLAGRKAAAYFKAHPADTFGTTQDFFRDLNFMHGAKVAEQLVTDYLTRRPSRLHVIYNEFKSAVAQKLVVESLLPFSPESFPAAERSDYIYEPADPSAVLTSLLKLHLEVQIYTIFLESYAAEQAARMTAMENAADNAVELNADLTLAYNRARQAGITKEIAEIVGGAEALK
ncbi:MAG: ATP synthase F1 subunit gamma [Candidatus Lindowbacteria bacterium RIFCSPLOWO2_12_FULL_62_27]|nr:MAG: ATP synthase F1 subunit gamma [Candidatus Lindowbacteria bacterium RIFCSPLOWO2_02_FULL_62_12]OGH61314.1 MAG: ATP synthase F1 subunit gamma [Candidatus Lindowbacteria bacterium RIFCSPLOWO2_12_FULL_62_27]